jgi:archaemetzincin
MSDEEKQAAIPDDLFPDIPDPGPGDWLSENFEPGQRFVDFLRERKRVPDQAKDRIYLQPIGSFDLVNSPPLEALKACAEAYFTLRVTVLNPLTPEREHIRSRINPATGIHQVRSADIMKLISSHMPDDAFCILGVTMEDLYPDEHWNFIFGEASSAEGTGIFSFARHDPAFYGEPRGNDSSLLLLRRSCKVLVHETAHLFFLSHCIYFHCIMNGSNHIEESDARPLHFCPICLRKLQASTGLEIFTWYKGLMHFYDEYGLAEEAGWVRQRLDRIAKRRA